VEHHFRHEYGRLVALLVRRVGLLHLEAVEDAVQGALLAALTAWVADGIPDDPSAWLYRVAQNHLVGALRKEQGHQRVLDGAADQDTRDGEEPVSSAFAGEVRDELLRMLFVCCDETIPQESRLVLALKTLCGFSTAEIAFRLFTTEANVHKRLARARERLRQGDVDTQTPRWTRSARAWPASTPSSTSCSMKGTCPRIRSTPSAPSCARRPSAWAPCWPPTRWALRHRPLPCWP
jgi:RNA polymerase sigma-70 factor (ECF subfamily)